MGVKRKLHTFILFYIQKVLMAHHHQHTVLAVRKDSTFYRLSGHGFSSVLSFCKYPGLLCYTVVKENIKKIFGLFC